ncbi:hypothetical protein Aeqsu_1685 [Aequorivita sublithincola DSM 14238]|uniref:P pilus assembly/Cpx signaling pathway, periplasmic inhibitor/zinc-resistance associated protein n=1 Tax=Aequorivita sublithincola (strain DSM 14238 / LMG 21431 / ACAM 643 / 9-3) TaxID=746697 RepID=I3YVZ8_AEQSU|nr:hypothetical protein [Aequorivita sublithincola]AFL81166.1 hypothetical protein Aeqsu_1685 [Aequorivita sublithincola DSM 14238]
MKKVLIIFMALATFAVNAQNKNSEKRENRKELKANLTPEQKADLKTKKMTLALDLNTSQQQKLKQLILKTENDKTETRQNRKEMTSLQKYETKSAGLDRQIALKKEMKEILTTEQLTKWEFHQSHIRNRMKDKKDTERKDRN